MSRWHWELSSWWYREHGEQILATFALNVHVLGTHQQVYDARHELETMVPLRRGTEDVMTYFYWQDADGSNWQITSSRELSDREQFAIKRALNRPGHLSERDTKELQAILNEIHPPEPAPAPKRIGRTEREACVDALSAHYQAERITGDEFTERMGKAFTAPYQSGLDALLADLPAVAQPAFTPHPNDMAPATPRTSASARAIIAFAVISMLALIAITVSAFL